jgi:hypothetical protein
MFQLRLGIVVFSIFVDQKLAIIPNCLRKGLKLSAIL